MKKLLSSEKFAWTKNINWKKVKKYASFLFFAVIAYVIVSKAMEIEWSKVFETFVSIPWQTLALGVFIAFCAYTAYSCYDVIGREVLKLEIARRRCAFISWICYAFNLNFGALIGSLAIRYKLYSNAGVSPKNTAKLIAISVSSNWLGYAFLLSILMLWGQLALPEDWPVGLTTFRVLAVVCLTGIATYFYFCYSARGKEIEFRDHTFMLPSIKVAFVQLGLACTHWTLMAFTMYQFFGSGVSFTEIYAILLVSALAGALMHVPGGLGVVEAVFITFLAGRVPEHEVIAALFAYRCVFYLVPLAIAVPSYLVMEVLGKSDDTKAETALKTS